MERLFPYLDSRCFPLFFPVPCIQTSRGTTMKIRISTRNERTLAAITIQAETEEERALLEHFKRDIAGQHSLSLAGPAFEGELILCEQRASHR